VYCARALCDDGVEDSLHFAPILYVSKQKAMLAKIWFME
jgi:hypothetical protein